MFSQIAVDSDLTQADRVTWVDGEQVECGSLLEVSSKMKHYHFGAKQEVFKDAVSALDCTEQRNEKGACEELFFSVYFIYFSHVNLGSI